MGSRKDLTLFKKAQQRHFANKIHHFANVNLWFGSWLEHNLLPSLGSLHPACAALSQPCRAIAKKASVVFRKACNKTNSRKNIAKLRLLDDA
jgi:hypothetical protein